MSDQLYCESCAQCPMAAGTNLEVFLFNEKLIDSVIDGCQIGLLDCYEVVLDQWQVVSLPQD